MSLSKTRTLDAKMMYEYKIKECTNAAPHPFQQCPNWHRQLNFKDRRRDPKTFNYDPCVKCEEFKPENDKLCRMKCTKYHALLERLYHPQIYKTDHCHRGASCHLGDLCSFLHPGENPRVPTSGGAKARLPQEDPKSTFDYNRFKTRPCKNASCTLPTIQCEDYHNDDDRRRDPFEYPYHGELCPDYSLYGECALEDDCTLAHGLYELLYHPDIYKSSFCKAKPCVKGSRCPFAHTDPEIKSCKLISDINDDMGRGAVFFMYSYHTVMCPFSCKKATCIYAHQAKELRRNPNYYEYNPRRPCVNYTEDFQCSEGNYCKFYHCYQEIHYHPQNYKAGPCDKYRNTGSCVLGIACAYLHPNEKPDTNTAAPLDTYSWRPAPRVLPTPPPSKTPSASSSAGPASLSNSINGVNVAPNGHSNGNGDSPNERLSEASTPDIPEPSVIQQEGANGASNNTDLNQDFVTELENTFDNLHTHPDNADIEQMLHQQEMELEMQMREHANGEAVKAQSLVQNPAKLLNLSFPPKLNFEELNQMTESLASWVSEFQQTGAELSAEVPSKGGEWQQNEARFGDLCKQWDKRAHVYDTLENFNIEADSAIQRLVSEISFRVSEEELGHQQMEDLDSLKHCLDFIYKNAVKIHVTPSEETREVFQHEPVVRISAPPPTSLVKSYYALRNQCEAINNLTAQILTFIQTSIDGHKVMEFEGEKIATSAEFLDQEIEAKSTFLEEKKSSIHLHNKLIECIVNNDPSLFNASSFPVKLTATGMDSFVSFLSTIMDKVNEARASKRLKTRGENKKEEFLCVKCSERARDIVFIPCGHMAVCYRCSSPDMTSCPMCQSSIVTRQRVVLS